MADARADKGPLLRDSQRGRALVALLFALTLYAVWSLAFRPIDTRSYSCGSPLAVALDSPPTTVPSRRIPTTTTSPAQAELSSLDRLKVAAEGQANVSPDSVSRSRAQFAARSEATRINDCKAALTSGRYLLRALGPVAALLVLMAAATYIRTGRLGLRT